MDSKPVVTYAGDQQVFSGIQPGLAAGLPTEQVEWKRSYGRNSRSVYVEVDFEPFDPEKAILGPRGLEGMSIFHTFWTDVTDLDTYRQGVKEDISAWQSTLKKVGSTGDWLVVVVEPPESKKGVNKFKTTVLDRLKQDVGGKTPERVISLIDPSKSDSRGAESMQSLLHRFRVFFLQSFNKVLNKFEENIRAQREKRTEASWNFCDYFLLQEQLAFVYENMGLYDESLIQYDELDALFTQFVLNCNVEDCPGWLEKFNNEIPDWTGVSLDRAINRRLSTKLESRCPSLLQLRNYLFSRQSQLLVLCGKPWEVARRSIHFLHNTLCEVSILELSSALCSAELCCWVLLSCLEVLSLPSLSSSPQQQALIHCAALWAYAAQKLLQLGSLCGLLPGHKQTSQQIHTIVTLTGGLQEDTYSHTEGRDNPLQRLKESLSSNQSFEKAYLEMCENAISNYKTVGRLRSAKLVGKDLAMFYLSSGEVHKAASFLAEGLKTFQNDGWGTLASATLLDLAECYKTLEDHDKYFRICAQIASCEDISEEKRKHFFKEMQRTLSLLTDQAQEDGVLVQAEKIVDFKTCIEEKSGVEQKLIPGAQMKFSLELESKLPLPLSCRSVSVSLSHVKPLPLPTPSPSPALRGKGASTPLGRRTVQRSPSAASNASNSSLGLLPNPDLTGQEAESSCDSLPPSLCMGEQLDYKQDKSLCAARLVCTNSARVLARKDSSGSILKDSQLCKADYSFSLGSAPGEEVLLLPGLHSYPVRGLAGPEGRYSVTQLSLQLSGEVELVHSCQLSPSHFTVSSEPPVLLLDRAGPASHMYAGLENRMVVSLFTGSRSLTSDSKPVILQCSRGLAARLDIGHEASYSSTLEVHLPPALPFQTVSMSILVKATLSNQKDSGSLEHRVSICDPWGLQEREVALHFVPAFYTTFTLHTAMAAKFLQVLLFPLTQEGGFTLSDHKLEFMDTAGESLQLTNINDEADVFNVDSQCEAGYLWQLIFPENKESTGSKEKPVKIKFSVNYELKSSELGNSLKKENYEVFFQFQDFRTLYTIQAKVEPAKGNEFCRAGTLCPMTVSLSGLPGSVNTGGGSLFYEILAEQGSWAVCGKQGAVIDIQGGQEGEGQEVVVEVMPLVGGHLALPQVRLSKYIPATGQGLGGARLDPFATGQVYNMSRSQQVHVLPPNNQNLTHQPGYSAFL